MHPIQVYTEFGPTGRNTAWRVAEGMACSKKTVIVCGAGISVAAGIPAFRSPHGWDESCLTTRGGNQLNAKCASFFGESANAKGEGLADINELLTHWRMTARVAPIASFHRLIHRMADECRLIKCVTRNFDGLETRDRPTLDSKVLMVHGDNRILTCGSGQCQEIGGEDVLPLEQDFLKRAGIVCPDCCRTRDLKEKQGKRFLSGVRQLRPAVLLDEQIDPDLQVGEMHEDLLEEIKGAQLLIVVGTSLKTTAMRHLVNDMAEKVHNAEGAVVFINTAEYKPGAHFIWVDFYLQMDAQVCAEAVMRIMDQSPSESALDIWQELWERNLTGEFVPQLPELTDRVCCQCAIGLEDTLFPCCKCGEDYCFEIPNDRMGRMCISLNYFTEEPNPLPFHESVKSFLCYNCFPHDGKTPYPHFVRRVTKFYDDPVTTPRLVLIVYYLSQFWPQAESLISSITTAWRTLGWPCYTAPVKLQKLGDQKELLSHCTWEPGTFRVLVVYVTHGMAGSRFYQLADNIEASPTEASESNFLDATLRPAAKLIANAQVASGYLLTCGYVYMSSENVSSIQAWVNQPGCLAHLVGTLNKRLSVAYMTNLIAQSTVAMSGYGTWNGSSVLDAWLRDSAAGTHTDLIYFGRHEEPRLFYFSPMQTRPLGRDLPDLLTTCNCTGGSIEESCRGKQKVWKVTHNGEHRKKLGTVIITAKCSLCGGLWHLNQPKMPGVLHKVAGLYAAEVPYFSDSVE